jgi:Holliday junction resolvase-like predicted endonuclease
MSESTAPAAWWANPSDRTLDRAADHLKRLGYRVLARQFRDCDLIAGRWPLVIACEVRARRIIQPVEDERSTRRKRLRLSASAWLSLPQNRGFHEVRFDRIDVYLSRGGELVGLEHYPKRSRKPDLPLRGDEGELFRRYHEWLVGVTR